MAIAVSLGVVTGLVGFAPRSVATVATAAAPSITSVPVSEWNRIVAVGAWHSGCPASRTTLRQVWVNYHGFDGRVHRGVLVVNVDVAPAIASIMTSLFNSGFPIHRMQPIETFNGDDNASMAADNTSAYNCRRASQANASPSASPHANGRAIDINPYENPWIDSRCNCFRPDAYFGSHRSGRGVITKLGVVWQAFSAAGWTWQDNSTIDYQHFDTGYPSAPFMPVPVTVGNAQQVITVQAHGSWATVVAWQRVASGWRVVVSTNAGRVGSNGVVAGSARRQGSYTTPTGTYALTQAFGIAPNPGTGLPYHHVTNADWWVEDNASRWYNTLRTAAQGGFRTQLPETNVNGSEHLIAHGAAYRYAVVIDYNMHPAVRYRGAGIFLHVSTGQPTAGCVAVPQSVLVQLMRWLQPTQHPRIAIGRA